MISKIGEVMQSNGDKCLDILQCTEVYFSEENKCTRITLNDATIENNLSSNQEEADMKVALHSKHAYERSPEKVAVAFFIRFSTPTRCSLVIPGLRPNPSIDLPTLILAE